MSNREVINSIIVVKRRFEGELLEFLKQKLHEFEAETGMSIKNVDFGYSDFRIYGREEIVQCRTVKIEVDWETTIKETS